MMKSDIINLREMISLENVLIKSIAISGIEFILFFVLPLIIMSYFVYNTRCRIIIAVLLLTVLLSIMGGYLFAAKLAGLLIVICIAYDKLNKE